MQAGYVIENARRKALEVLARTPDADIVIGCDSVVVADHSILEKPRDEAHARSMMTLLSGRSHDVYSGVAVILRRAACDAPPVAPPAPEASSSSTTSDLACHAVPEDASRVIVTFSERTSVHFAPLTAAIIDAYVRTRDPYDKAGGYGIQSIAGQFVTGIQGDYYNVMGLPLHRLCAVMRSALLGHMPLPVTH